jgi:uncharacterized protein (TIGR02271 family)
MFDLFFNGVATMFEMQRAFASRGMMVPVSANFGHSDRERHTHQNRHIEIGGAEEQVIPIPKEELRVGKRQVQSSKVYRISSTVVEVPVEEQVRLRAETVVIERRPTTGTTVRGGQPFQEHTIAVHEMYEEPVIGKVVTQAEEMVIYKTLSERTATVRDTVRHTRVNVDGQAQIQVRPPLEIPHEVSLKVDEQPHAPVQPPMGNVHETSLKAEEKPKVSISPQAEIARDIGAKIEEQKKDPVHSHAQVEVTAGPRHVPGEKSHELTVSQSASERKDHTNSGNAKPQRS